MAAKKASSKKPATPVAKRYRISKPEHGSQDWLTVRFQNEKGEKRISASAAAAIFGLHRFVTPDKYAAELLNDTPPEPTPATWAMQRGNDLEPLCIRWHTERTGINWFTPEEMFAYDHPNGARLIATLDGFFEDGDTREVLEIKTYNRQWDGVLPDYWRIQGIQQALCANVDRIHWGVFDGSLQLHTHIQPVSQEEKDELVTKASEWLSAIDMGVTPPGVTWSFASVQERYPAPLAPDMLEVGETWAELVTQLRHVKTELASYKALEDELKAKLCELIGEHEGITINGNVAATWKGQTRSSFDQKSLKADHPELAEKYTKNIIVRTLLLKGDKS